MFVNNSSASSQLDIQSTLERIKIISDSMKGFPTAFVMTNREYQSLKAASKVESPCVGQPPIASPYGIKFEVYDTVRECLDRMHDAKPHERLKLALSQGEIKLEDFNHPYVKKMLFGDAYKESE